MLCLLALNIVNSLLHWLHIFEAGGCQVSTIKHRVLNLRELHRRTEVFLHSYQKSLPCGSVCNNRQALVVKPPI